MLKLLLETDESLTSAEVATRTNLKSGVTSDALCRLAAVGLVWRQPTGRHVFWGPNVGVITMLTAFLSYEGPPKLPPTKENK